MDSNHQVSRHYSLHGVGEEEIHLRELLRTLWRRKMVLIGTFLIITVASVLIVEQIVPRYTANALIMINNRQTQVVDVEAVLSALSSDAATVQSEVEVLRSRSLIGRVVAKLDLGSHPAFMMAKNTSGMNSIAALVSSVVPKGWLEAAGINIIESEVDVTQASGPKRALAPLVDQVIGRLSVTPVNRSRVIRVGYQSENPELAAAVTNAVAEQYIVDQLEAKFDATKRATSWLSGRITNLRDKVRVAENAVELYRAESDLADGKVIRVSQQQLTEVNSQLIISQTERAESEARYRMVQGLLKKGESIEAAAETLSSPLILRLKDQESQMQRRVSELSTRYGDKHPKMVNAKTEVSDIKGRLEGEVRKIVQNLSNEVEVSRARVRSIGISMARLEDEIAEQNHAEIRLRELQREANANRLLYEAFLTRFKETREQEEIQQPDARVISRAEIPTSRSYPRKTMIVGLSAGGSILLGIILIFLLERLDSGFRSAQQIEQKIGVPMIGMIPLVKGMGKKGQAETQVIDRPSSSFSESVRSLLTALQLSNIDRPPKIISITSALPSEGKTTLSLSLARVAALSGKKVIVVDCDFRRPALHKVSRASQSGNIIDLLTNNYELEDVIKEDTASGAHIITAKVLQGNPLDLLSSQHMKKLVGAFGELYDMVILDAPSVLAVSDARVLSRLADKTIFVVKWDSTPREAVAAGVKQLTEVNADLAGVVLDQVDVRKHAKYGYGDSGYYYGRYREYYAD